MSKRLRAMDDYVGDVRDGDFSESFEDAMDVQVGDAAYEQPESWQQCEVLDQDAQTVCEVPEGDILTTMDEINFLRKSALWPNFSKLVNNEMSMSGVWFQVLNYHTSDNTSADSPGNLATCGYRDGIRIDRHSPQPMFMIHLHLPGSFCPDDGLEVDYFSTPHRLVSEAQRAACAELFCFLLYSSPAKVVTHYGFWKNGAESWAYLQTQARICLNNVHIPPERGHSLAARVAFCAQHPRKPHGAVKDKGLPKQVDHELCTKAIRKLDPDVWHETNALPMEVVEMLDQGMPKNGLLEWCEENPNIVEVMYTGQVSKKKKNTVVQDQTCSP